MSGQGFAEGSRSYTSALMGVLALLNTLLFPILIEGKSFTWKLAGIAALSAAGAAALWSLCYPLLISLDRRLKERRGAKQRAEDQQDNG